MPSNLMIAAIGGSFLLTALFFSWLAVSIVRLRRSSHARNNIQQQIVLMLELVCQELKIDLGHVADRAKQVTDSGEKW
jgi:hypothetical protein